MRRTDPSPRSGKRSAAFSRMGPDYILFDTAQVWRCPGARGLGIRSGDRAEAATEFLSADGVGRVLGMMGILQSKKNWRGNLLGILPTFHDEQTRESRATMDLKQRFASSLLPPIHRSTLLRECAAQGQTIFEMDELCRAAREYLALTQFVRY